ncbi:hypothetical protein ACFOY2_05120 [Nonomuraea purpurea]|uniref:Uncharacterized protein n=1 Tax=Nonomuraea purpurea TaxID=1849276 RepID=A0ABV8FXX9_9ACTN
MLLGDEMAIRRSAYELGLDRGHCDPVCGGLGNGHFVVDAASFVAAAGYDPDEHPDVVEALETELREVVVDTAADVMREHGLRSETDPLAPANGDADA